MSKTGTLGYYAQNARRKAQRRLEQINEVLSSANVSERIKEWASAQKREIKSAMQGTRMYSSEGKRYKTKTKKYIEQQISRLNAATEAVMPRLSTEPTYREQRINAFTQRQMNLASLSKKSSEASIYNKVEVSVFYAATRKIWEKPGVNIEDRNAAILQYFNEERMVKGLKPITLKDIMDEIVKRNEVFIGIAKAESSMRTGNTEYDDMVRETVSQQNEREKEGSPTSNIPRMILFDLVDQIYEALNVPNPMDF